jgi:Dolichyl-phosphate-mannose-protein mannosyltransferase
MGRFLSVFAGSAAVVLAGFLVRHRGALAVLLTGGIIAIYPVAAVSSRTVLLEPWLVLFCLAGAVAVFDGDRLTSRTRRLAWGGAAFGFSTAGWVLLTPKSSVRIPWNPALLAYFESHFRLARQLSTSTLYVRDGARSARKPSTAG